MKNKRLMAFTIMEMTIAMLLASITIALTYTIYSIFAQTYNAYNKKNKLLAIPIQLNQLLNKDFNNAAIILKTDSGITFKSAGQDISYKFEPEMVLRTQIIVDTFKVNISNVETAFERTPVIEVYSSDEQNRIDGLQFKLLLEAKLVTYHYSKQYSSVNLIQRNHAVN